MSQVAPVVYSAKDLNFALAHPYVPAGIQFSGVQEKGVNKVTVRMARDQTTTKVGADGAVIMNALAGDNGSIEVEVWQVSTIHEELLAFKNALNAARDAGDVSQWATASIVVANTVAGTSHNANGCSPLKIPDVTYGEEAEPVVWTFVCGNIASQ